MDNALLVIFALLLNAVFGGPRAVYEATGIARIGRIPAKLLRDRERLFNTPERQLLLIVYVIVIALVTGGLLHVILRNNMNFFEVLLLACLLPVRPAFERALQIKQALAKQDLQSARQALDGTVWRHHVLLDEHGVARAGIELLAVDASERVITPILWYMLLGIPGIVLCKSISLMRQVLPASYAVDKQVNMILLKVPALLSWVGARLASILWIAASLFVPSSDIAKTVSRFAGEITRQPTLPYILFTVATVLNVSLGGPTSAYANTGWYGDGTPKAAHGDVARALMLYALVFVLLFILLGLFLK